MPGAMKDRIDTGEEVLNPDTIPALVVFRCTFLLFFYTVLISWNTYGWRTAGMYNVQCKM